MSIRTRIKLKVIRSYSTDRTDETLWIFVDSKNTSYKWYTKSKRLLLEGNTYLINTEIVAHVDGNYLHDPRVFKSLSRT